MSRLNLMNFISIRSELACGGPRTNELLAAPAASGDHFEDLG